MKRIIPTLALIPLLILSSCQQKAPDDYSDEIEVIKKITDALVYTGHEELFDEAYADTAKLYWNSVHALSPKEALRGMELALEHFTDMRFLEGKVYETVTTAEGQTWIGFWGVWEGRVKEHSTVVQLPVHLISRFENGKIVEESGFWDNQHLNDALAHPDSPEHE